MGVLNLIVCGQAILTTTRNNSITRDFGARLAKDLLSIANYTLAAIATDD